LETPDQNFLLAQEILDKEGPFLEKKFYPIDALSKLAYRMQITITSIKSNISPVSIRKAAPLKQLKSLS